MKKQIRNVVFYILGALLLSTAADAAQWVGVQGNDAVLEYPGNTTRVNYKGWGLDFVEKAYLSNWVHLPITVSVGTQQVRYIWIKYYKQYAGASIGQADIYNGNSYLQTVAVSNSTTAGWNWILLDLGAYKGFYDGLGVSLSVNPAYALDTNFQFGAAEVLQQ